MTTNTEALERAMAACMRIEQRRDGVMEMTEDDACALHGALLDLQSQAPAPSFLAREEAEHRATISERDLVEGVLSDLVTLVLGRAPEWSSCYGYADALDECRDMLAVPAPVAVPPLTPAMAEAFWRHVPKTPSMWEGDHCRPAAWLADAWNAALAAAPPAPSVSDRYRDGLEAALRVAKRAAEPRDCDALGPTDMSTGVSECALERRGGDCLCAERMEAAEEIVAAIRALIDQPAPSGEAQDWRARAEKAEAERDALRLQNDALRSGASLRTQLADFDRIEAQLAEARARTVAYPDGSSHTDPGEPVQRIAQGRQQEGQTNA